MFDDLRRNFVMNPQNGLSIKPFKRCHANRESDQELVKLTQYLLDIARLDDLSTLDHKHWESFANVKRRRHDQNTCAWSSHVLCQFVCSCSWSGYSILSILLNIFVFLYYGHMLWTLWFRVENDEGLISRLVQQLLREIVLKPNLIESWKIKNYFKQANIWVFSFYTLQGDDYCWVVVVKKCSLFKKFVQLRVAFPI